MTPQHPGLIDRLGYVGVILAIGLFVLALLLMLGVLPFAPMTVGILFLITAVAVIV